MREYIGMVQRLCSLTQCQPPVWSTNLSQVLLMLRVSWDYMGAFRGSGYSDMDRSQRWAFPVNQLS